MTSPGRWCDHVAPVTSLVTCNGEQHHITWRRGKLVLEEHDLGAERAMAALGEPPCFCMQALRVWRDQWAMPPDLFRRMAGHLGPVALPEMAGVRELAVTLNWERTWRRAAYFTKHAPLIRAQVRDRAVGPLRRHLEIWCRRLGCRRVAAAEVELAKPGDSPLLLGTIDSVAARATAVLGASWILHVWTRGLAVVGDALVLEVLEERATQELLVRAARWDMPPAGRATPLVGTARARQVTEGPWELTWETAGGVA